MPDNKSLFVFDFTAELAINEPKRSTSAPDSPPPTNQPEIPVKSIVTDLNKHAGTIADEIEQEIRPVLPERGTVHVVISFSEGSVIAIGTALVTFLQPVIQEALKTALEEQIKSVISFAIARVLPRYVPAEKIKAAPIIQVDPVSSSTAMNSTQPNTPAGTTISPPTQDQLSTRNLLWLTGINTVLLVILLGAILLSLLHLIP